MRHVFGLMLWLLTLSVAACSAAGPSGGASGTLPDDTATTAPSAAATPPRVPPISDEQSRACSGPGKRVCLVPFGAVPDEWVQAWASHIRSSYGIDVRVLAAIDALDAWYPAREQVLAEGAISVVKREYRPDAGDFDAAFVIVTTLDMFTKDVEPFIFGHTELGRFGIVSGYHMDPRHRGASPDDALLRSRMLKLITKYVGMTYFRLPEEKGRQSLMYGPIDSIAILDSLPAELPSR